MRNVSLLLALAAMMSVFVAVGAVAEDEGTKEKEIVEDVLDGGGIELMKGVSMGALIEIEGAYQKQGDEKASDIVLATFELSIDAKLMDGVAGHAVLLWEEDEGPFAVDEAYISLGGTDSIPVTLDAGRLFVPFGVFNTHMVSDPLTLQLGETSESAAIIGYANDYFEASVGAFNGDVDDASHGDHVYDFVASAAVTPAEFIEFGAYWISDIGEGGLEEGLLEAVEGTQDEVGIGPGGLPEMIPGVEGLHYRNVGGIGGYLSLNAGPFSLEAEYLGAVDEFDRRLVGDERMRPKSWNLEAAYSLLEDWEFAVRYEGSEDFHPEQMPESQFGGAVTYSLTDYSSVAFEYLHGEFKDDSVHTRDLFTLQLALKF